MKIGWLSKDFCYTQLLENLSLANHEIYFLSDNKMTLNFQTNMHFFKVNNINQLLQTVDVVFTYFHDSDAVAKTYMSDSGIFNILKETTKKLICIDLSSTSVNLIKKISLDKIPQVDFLDAPIIVSVKPDNKFSYIIPVSGKKYVFDKIKKVLADFEVEYYYAGPMGSSQVICTANNILKSAITLGVFEALNYAQSNQLDLNVLYDAVSSGAGGSEIFLQYFKDVCNGNFDLINKNFIATASQILNVLKDNKQERKNYLLSRIVFGILKKVNSDFTNLKVDFFAEFYPLCFNDETNNNYKFEASFLIPDENDLFITSTIDFKKQKKESINQKELNNNSYNSSDSNQPDNVNFTSGFNSLNDFHQKTDGAKNKLENIAIVNEFINSNHDENLISNNNKVISEAKLIEVEEKDISNLNDNIKLDYLLTENKFISEMKDELLSQKNESDIYKTPKSLEKTVFSKKLKNFFESDKEAELDSLVEKNDYNEGFSKDEKITKESFTNKNFVEEFILNEYEKNKEINESSLISNEIFKNDSSDLEDDFFSLDFPELRNENEFSNQDYSKTLIFDLDGTLLNNQHYVSDQNVKALQKANEIGHTIVIATGRCYQQTKDTINKIGVVKYAILNNGGFIFDILNNIIIENSNVLSKRLRCFFLEIVFANKISFLMYSDLDLYVYCFNKKDYDKFSMYMNNETKDLSKLSYKELKKIVIDENLRVYNFSAYSEALSENDWVKLFKVYKEDFKECNMTSALEHYIDIYDYYVSKYSGYLKLKEVFQCQDENVYFFGDSNNDYELMSHLINSIAMGNANQKIKAVAKYQISDNDTDGISLFLDENIFSH